MLSYTGDVYQMCVPKSRKMFTLPYLRGKMKGSNKFLPNLVGPLRFPFHLTGNLILRPLDSTIRVQMCKQ